MLAECCEIVYAKVSESSSRWKSRLTEELESLRIQPTLIIDSADVQAFVGLHYEHRIFCFRGTDSHAEFLTNIFAKRVADPNIGPGVKVHRHFARDVDVVMAAIEREEKRNFNLNYLHEGYTNWFIGHSRGGAAASIMAARVSNLRRCTWTGFSRANLVTHEMPRAGNSGFANFLRDSVDHLRWQRAGDLTPLVPFPPLFFHDTLPSYFDSGGRLRPDATSLTRFMEYCATILRHGDCPVKIGLMLHNMRDLHKMISKEESDHPRKNLLLDRFSSHF